MLKETATAWVLDHWPPTEDEVDRMRADAVQVDLPNVWMTRKRIDVLPPQGLQVSIMSGRITEGP